MITKIASIIALIGVLVLVGLALCGCVVEPAYQARPVYRYAPPAVVVAPPPVVVEPVPPEIGRASCRERVSSPV